MCAERTKNLLVNFSLDYLAPDSFKVAHLTDFYRRLTALQLSKGDHLVYPRIVRLISVYDTILTISQEQWIETGCEWYSYLMRQPRESEDC